MDLPIVLRNKDRRRGFECTLYHNFVCVGAGECICIRRQRTEADCRNEFILAERTLYIPPRGLSEPLPAAVLQVPQVQVAMNTHHQLVQETSEAKVQITRNSTKE